MDHDIAKYLLIYSSLFHGYKIMIAVMVEILTEEFCD